MSPRILDALYAQAFLRWAKLKSGDKNRRECIAIIGAIERIRHPDFKRLVPSRHNRHTAEVREMEKKLRACEVYPRRWFTEAQQRAAEF